MQFNNVVLTAVALLLAGCGGSSGGSGGSDNDDEKTGVFVDSAVINIDYETSSGITGTTNSDGEFQYKEGDTVTFSIGDLTFPSVTASGTVTPLDLAGTTNTSDDEVVNIIRLLQTLDQDGDPENGITITAAAKAAATAVDFDQSTEDFESDTAVITLIQNGGQDTIPTELVSEEDAVAHLEDTLGETDAAANSITGTWYQADEESDGGAVLVFFKDGTYLFASTNSGSEDGVSQNGMEWGTYSRDESTGLTTFATTFDGNDHSGFSDFTSADLDTNTMYLVADDDTLTATITENGETYTNTATAATSSGLYGTWVTSASEDDLLAFTFLDNGTYIHYEVDSTDTTEQSGAEWGYYSVDDGYITVSSTFYDDNGDNGFTDYLGLTTAISYSIVDDDILRLFVDENQDGTNDDYLPFVRMSAAEQTVPSSVTGVWSFYINADDFAYMTLMEDGKFVYLENDPDATAENSNGLEEGTYTYDSSTGEITFDVIYDDNSPGNDSGVGDIGADNIIPFYSTANGSIIGISNPTDGDLVLIKETFSADIQGVWSANATEKTVSEDEFGYLGLFADGHFYYGEYDATVSSSDENGLELGTYTYDSSTGTLSFDLEYDDNAPGDDSGVGDIGTTSKFSTVLDGDTLTLEGALTFSRKL